MAWWGRTGAHLSRIVCCYCFADAPAGTEGPALPDFRQNTEPPQWDEQAACELVGSWAYRVGAAWPDGLSTVQEPAGTLWDRYQADIDAAFAVGSWPMLYQAFEDFRPGAGPLLRAWRERQRR